MEILSSFIFLLPLGFVMMQVMLATNQKEASKTIIHILWAMLFMLMFISNQLARMYQ